MSTSDGAGPHSNGAMHAAFEAIGGVSIGLAATLCSAVIHLRSSPAALATVLGCLIVLFPFLCAAGVILTIGMVCCVPVLMVGLVCASVPALLRRARAASQTAARCCNLVVDHARDNPLIAAGIGLMALPLLPIVLVRWMAFAPTLRNHTPTAQRSTPCFPSFVP
jgi:hypothetical protein